MVPLVANPLDGPEDPFTLLHLVDGLGGCEDLAAPAIEGEALAVFVLICCWLGFVFVYCIFG